MRWCNATIVVSEIVGNISSMLFQNILSTLFSKKFLKEKIYIFVCSTCSINIDDCNKNIINFNINDAVNVDTATIIRT